MILHHSLNSHFARHEPTPARKENLYLVSPICKDTIVCAFALLGAAVWGAGGVSCASAIYSDRFTEETRNETCAAAVFLMPKRAYAYLSPATPFFCFVATLHPRFAGSTIGVRDVTETTGCMVGGSGRERRRDFRFGGGVTAILRRVSFLFFLLCLLERFCR